MPGCAATTSSPRLPRKRPSGPRRASVKVVSGRARARGANGAMRRNTPTSAAPCMRVASSGLGASDRPSGSGRARRRGCRGPGSLRARRSGSTPRSPRDRDQRRVEEHRAAVDEAGQRIALAEAADVVQRHEVDRGAARRVGGLAPRRWSGSRSSAGLASPTRSAGRPGRTCRTARPTVAASSLFVVTDPNPPIEWPRRLKQPLWARLDCQRRRAPAGGGRRGPHTAVADFDRISQPVEDRQQIGRRRRRAIPARPRPRPPAECFAPSAARRRARPSSRE